LTHYRTLAAKSKYWRPGTNYNRVIAELVSGLVDDGDTVVVSEKAVAMAQGRICDESAFVPSSLAKFIARFWMRRVWGYLLGPLTRMSRINIERVRNYPAAEGAAHKQAAISYAGVLQALRHSSEGGIDVSNVPYTYACLPLPDPTRVAEEIRKHLEKTLDVRAEVMIVDSDKTYTFHNLHISPRPSSVRGIRCLGLPAYVLGRVLRLRPRSTPIAYTKSENDPESALRIAAIANKARGDGAGKTIWDTAQRFNVHITGVSWEMLESVPHHPLVIVRGANPG